MPRPPYTPRAVVAAANPPPDNRPSVDDAHIACWKLRGFRMRALEAAPGSLGQLPSRPSGHFWRGVERRAESAERAWRARVRQAAGRSGRSPFLAEVAEATGTRVRNRISGTVAERSPHRAFARCGQARPRRYWTDESYATTTRDCAVIRAEQPVRHPLPQRRRDRRPWPRGRSPHRQRRVFYQVGRLLGVLTWGLPSGTYR